MTSGETTLHSSLRLATRSLHRRVDHHPVMTALMRGPLTMEAYGRALLGLHDAQRWGESEIEAIAPACLFPRRLDDLRADLRALGIEPDRPGDAVRPTLAVGSGSCSDIHRLGILYVLEGSLVGAQHMAHRIRAQPPPEATGWPLSFLGRPRSPERWSALWSLAERLAGTNPSTNTIDECCAGAIEAFGHYVASLDSVQSVSIERAACTFQIA